VYVLVEIREQGRKFSDSYNIALAQCDLVDFNLDDVMKNLNQVDALKQIGKRNLTSFSEIDLEKSYHLTTSVAIIRSVELRVYNNNPRRLDLFHQVSSC
jgi:hypothetical protein